MKDHQKAQLVNELRDIAKEFHDFDCLREMIRNTLIKYMGTEWWLEDSKEDHHETL